LKIELSEEALAFGKSVLQAVEAAGGDELVRNAESDPGRREDIVAPVLGELGAWDLDPRADADDLEASAALCRAAGYWSAPYPVAERLARPAGGHFDGLVVVPEPGPAVAPLAALDGHRWAVVTLDGLRGAVNHVVARGTPRMAAFAADLSVRWIDGQGAGDVALALVLPCWTLLGMLDRAIDLARSHVGVREQFGQKLSAFQGVQFQLTDAEVERSGLEMLAKYALWAIQAGLPEAMDDALALRMAALEAAEVVFRVAHQVHGAMGFCDEAPLSWLSRYSQPIRRYPFGLSATRALLAARIGRRGLTGIYSEEPPA
jgi:alkylation response protein AidB-like acyl-CoA dehydrogenase